MNNRHIPDWLFSLAAILPAMAIALYLRIALPYPTVFDGQWIKLTGIDAYYYMRLVDNLLANFPQLTTFDPFMIFRSGDSLVRVPNFFAYMLAGTVRLLGGASATQATADSIAVYLPAVLGALTIIPVFFIGRAVSNRWGGMVAALLAAAMPGELLSRSLLGNTDHHAAEIFFTSFFLMFFMLALKNSRHFTYAMVKNGQFPPASHHIPYSIIAGLFLGLYLITWQGALLFVLIIFIYFVIQFISDHLRGLPTDYLSKTAITCFLIALLIFLPFSRDRMTLLALAALILVPIALNIISILMTARGLRPIYYLLVVGGLLALGGLGTWLLFPYIFNAALGNIAIIFSWRVGQTVVGEMKPLLFQGDTFTLDMAWLEFALALYSGLAGLALLIYACIKKGGPQHMLTAAWSIVIMLAALAMVRFSAYFSISLAVLSGYLAGTCIAAFQPKAMPESKTPPVKKFKRTSSKTRRAGRTAMALGLLTAACVIGIMIPGTAIAVAVASRPSHSPSNAWMEALQWMQTSTPEPFGAADYYYRLYNLPAPGNTFAYPSTAYGVMVWNDYGYWVTRIGHRLPVANPGITNKDEARFYTAQDKGEAAKIMDGLDVRYVILDNRIVSPNDKFYAVAGLSDKKEADFYELCWQKKDGKYVPLLVFYPEYYRTMVSRLYNFDGKQVVPQQTPVMTWTEQRMPDGQAFKEITGLRNFGSYGEAEYFVAGQKEGNHRIVGTDPLASPVPLEALDKYKLVYQSKETASAGSSPMPAIKIFEYSR